MMTAAWAWTDGSNGRSSGKEGAAAYVVADAETKEVLEERCEMFPHPSPTARITNNDMEMAAVMLCLQSAISLGVTDLKIHSDSEFAVNIITGAYKLKNLKFKTMLEEIRRLGRELDSVEIVHIPREKNSRADWLCSVATNQKRAKKSQPSLCWDMSLV